MNIREMLNQIKPYVLGWCGGYSSGLYTVVWAGGSTPPAIGNGTLKGHYTRIGNLVTAGISMTWGSTTSGGNSAWTFNLPFVAGVNGSAVGTVWILDTGSQLYVGQCMVYDGDGVIAAYGPITNLTYAYPHTWAVNDVLKITITYECA